MPRVGRSVIIVGTSALVLAAGSGIATAAVMSGSSPVDSSGVIHGCWTNGEINGSHAFVLQDAGISCPKEPPQSPGTPKDRLGLQDRRDQRAR
jgi:hypothetical protein